MNNKFDELAKGLALSVTRRGALKKFGCGLAGIALTALGLTNKAEAARGCTSNADCPGRKVCNCHKPPPYHGCSPLDGNCIAYCRVYCNPV